MLFVFSMPLSATPHAPLNECATEHHCCCSAEAKANHACCCFAGKAFDASGVVGTLIRAVQCSGTASDKVSPTLQTDWMLVRVDESRHVEDEIALVVGNVPALHPRTAEPLLPPPIFLVAV